MCMDDMSLHVRNHQPTFRGSQVATLRPESGAHVHVLVYLWALYVRILGPRAN